MTVKTSEEILADLNQALTDARAATRDLHQATRDAKTFYRHEREQAERVLREETALAITAVAAEVRAYLVAQVDVVVSA